MGSGDLLISVLLSNEIFSKLEAIKLKYPSYHKNMEKTERMQRWNSLTKAHLFIELFRVEEIEAFFRYFTLPQSIQQLTLEIILPQKPMKTEQLNLSDAEALTQFTDRWKNLFNLRNLRLEFMGEDQKLPELLTIEIVSSLKRLSFFSSKILRNAIGTLSVQESVSIKEKGFINFAKLYEALSHSNYCLKSLKIISLCIMFENSSLEEMISLPNLEVLKLEGLKLNLPSFGLLKTLLKQPKLRKFSIKRLCISQEDDFDLLKNIIKHVPRKVKTIIKNTTTLSITLESIFALLVFFEEEIDYSSLKLSIQLHECLSRSKVEELASLLKLRNKYSLSLYYSEIELLSYDHIHRILRIY